MKGREKSKGKMQIIENELENCCALSRVCSCYGMYVLCDFASIENLHLWPVIYFYMMHWKIEDIFHGKNIASCEKSRNDLWNKINLYFVVKNIQRKVTFLLFLYLYQKYKFLSCTFIDYYLYIYIYFFIIFLEKYSFYNRNIDNVS